MNLNGWLLDIQFRDTRAILWIKTKEKRVQVTDTYNPDFYVIPRNLSKTQFTELFEEHDYIKEIHEAYKYTTIQSTTKSRVQRVIVDTIEHYRKVVKLVEKYGEIYDSDLSHTQKYLSDHKLIPLGPLRAELDRRHNLLQITSVPRGRLVEPPPFKVLCFELTANQDQLDINTFDQGMEPEYLFNGPVEQVLVSFMTYLDEQDPDLIACLDTDLKKLLNMCLKYKLPRIGEYHNQQFKLKGGRVHLNLFSYRRMSLAGMVERIQYTREVPRIGSEFAAGRAIESRQVYEARMKGYLLPRVGFFQPVMSLEELLRERDHGGLIFAPSVGLHENVAALDFESMFPNLILKHNISYENIREEREHEGFLLDFTRETLDRRLYFKHHRKELRDKPEEWFWCETRQQVLKEILFCTYGYSGCWANRFGNMDTFMEINKVARENLVRALNIARKEGFHTLYGNSDSLFLIKENAARKDYDDLANNIEEQLDLPIAVENHFRYLVLLPQKSGKDFGAINRYYGIRYDDETVCRGIELRRRNTPSFIAETQRNAIRALLSQESKENVKTIGVEEARKIFAKACRELKHGLVPVEQLIAKTVLRRKPSKYKAMLPHVAAAEALSINGNEVGKGSVIEYVFVDAGHKNPFRRVSPAGYHGKFDAGKYIQLVKEAGKSLLMPFKLRKEEKKRTSLDSFIRP